MVLKLLLKSKLSRSASPPIIALTAGILLKKKDKVRIWNE
jgi:hypothetical protein